MWRLVIDDISEIEHELSYKKQKKASVADCEGKKKELFESTEEKHQYKDQAFKFKNLNAKEGKGVTK